MPKESDILLPPGTIVPNHIAIILDGNGRWARSRGLPVTKGHEEGAKAIKNVMDIARSWGIHTLTVWGFSTDNWKRPSKEKIKIFRLIKQTIQNELDTAKRDGIRFVHLGRKDRLPKDLLALIYRAESETKENKNHVLNVALDYGGRDEILRAVKKIVKDGVFPDDINEDLFSSYLDTAGQPYPYPDLFIRTSGELRTSGFLPWQMTYSEFYFEEDHLPDMDGNKLRNIVLDFSRRRRRFGAKDKVKHFTFKPEVIARLELNWWRLRNIPEGTRFRDYAIEHVKEQFGVSKGLAKKAGKYLVEAVVEGNQNKWDKSLTATKKFYRLIKGEIKLAFEPSLAASLDVKLWKDILGKETLEESVGLENVARELYAEVYRISLFQAAKAAHLRILASLERNLAEGGYGEEHWVKAEDYLQKFYSALKERVA